MTAQHSKVLSQTYAHIAATYETRNVPETISPELIRTREFFAETLPQRSNILDLGAGNGRDSEFFSNYGHETTLFDLSSEMLELAKKRVPNGTFIVGDMTDLPFKDSEFNGIWASLSLLHLTKAETKSVLEKIHAILKPNGLFYILLKKGEGEKTVEEDKYGITTQRFFSFYELPEL